MTLLSLLLLCAPASAFWFNGGIKQTAGSQGYYGTTLSVTAGHHDFSFKPEYSTYRSDVSGGQFRALSGRLAYEPSWYGVGASAGGTNRVEGYYNRWFGFDLSASITPSKEGPKKKISAGAVDSAGPARGEGLLRLDFGFDLRHTVHVDRFEAAPGTRRAAILRRNGREFEIGQTDFTGSIGASLFGNMISFDATKSRYTRDIGGNNVRANTALRLRGVGPTVAGFPDTSVTGRFETSMPPVVTPYIQYTRTRFVIGQPDAHTLGLGGSLELGIVEVTAGYERYTQRGTDAQNYFTAGGTLRF